LLQQHLNYPEKKKIWRKKLIFPYIRPAETAMTVAQEPKFASKKLFFLKIKKKIILKKNRFRRAVRIPNCSYWAVFSVTSQA